MANELHPLVFIPRADSDQKTTIYTMKFPIQWAEKLKSIYRLVLDKSEVSLPIQSLNAVIESLFPDVVRTERNAVSPYSGWIIANKVIDTTTLLNAIKAWINNTFLSRASDKNVKEKVNAVKAELKTTDLVWDEIEVDLFQDSKSKNGTIEPTKEYFDAIPEYICNRLCKDTSFILNGEYLSFRRSGGAEMMSWPPIEYKSGKGKRWYYSIVMSFAIQTAPFLEHPLILMNVSTRRFISESLVRKLPWDISLTALLSTSSYWYEKGEVSGFSKAKFRYDTKNPDKVSWQDQINTILNDLSFGIKLPNLPDLIKEPEKYINNNLDMTAAIMFNNQTTCNHKVGTGVSMKDKRELYEQVARYLPELEKAVQPQRVNLQMEKNQLCGTVKKINAAECRSALQTILGPRVNIEIRYQSDDVKDAIKEALQGILGIDDITDNTSLYRTNELEIGISILPLGRIGDKLDPEKGHLGRVKEIESAIEKVDVPTGCLAELRGKESWGKKEDPKGAIREGLAKRERVTQFITPDSDNASEEDSKLSVRAENAVWDLLRHFGYMPCPPEVHIKKSNLNSKFSLFGVWIVRKNESEYRKNIKFPVVIYMDTDSNKIKMKCPLFDRWYSYLQGQIEICKHTNFQENSKFRMKDEDIAAFVRKTLRETSEVDNPVIMAESSNIRQWWKWISDKKVDKSNLWVSDENSVLNSGSYSNMRVIRIRANDEVPDYYSVNTNTSQEGFTGGLFKISDHVFWSVAKKPLTLKKVIPNSSRILKHSTNFKFPNITEIVPVFLPEGDKPDDWAYAIHKMREMLSYYDDYATLPAPLHLAKKIEEYIHQVE